MKNGNNVAAPFVVHAMQAYVAICGDDISEKEIAEKMELQSFPCGFRYQNGSEKWLFSPGKLLTNTLCTATNSLLDTISPKQDVLDSIVRCNLARCKCGVKIDFARNLQSPDMTFDERFLAFLSASGCDAELILQTGDREPDRISADNSAQCYIEAAISGHHLDFDDITSSLQIKPTIFRKEESFPESSKRAGYAADEWLYQTRKIHPNELSSELCALLNDLKSRENALLSLKKKYAADILVTAVITRNSRYDFVIPHELCSFIHRIGINLALDV